MPDCLLSEISWLCSPPYFIHHLSFVPVLFSLGSVPNSLVFVWGLFLKGSSGWLFLRIHKTRTSHRTPALTHLRAGVRPGPDAILHWPLPHPSFPGRPWGVCVCVCGVLSSNGCRRLSSASFLTRDCAGS